MNNNYRIFNRNSLEFIKTMRDNSVDFIFTDPPYNISQYSTGNIKFSHRSDINNDIANWDRDFYSFHSSSCGMPIGLQITK